MTRSQPPHRLPPRSVEEALRRAATHGRNAVAEAVAACHALIDAAALVASGRPAEDVAGFATVGSLLAQFEAQLAGGGEASQQYTAPLLGALAEALDTEIARWERRARTDADARAVLRAFLGLRELLWELGVRAERGRANVDRDFDDEREDEAPPTDEAGQADKRDESAGSPRVQRIRVHG